MNRLVALWMKLFTGSCMLGACLCLASPVSAQALTTIEVPGAEHTFAQGMNGRGDVVGFYTTFDGRWHGFHWSGGVITTIDMPDATSTALYGINDRGDLVGEARFGVGFDSYGFVIRQGTVEMIPGPAGEGPTTAYGINDRGDIVGSYLRTGSGRTGFWMDRQGSFHSVSFGPELIVQGINNSGEMVGQIGDVAYSGFVIDTQGEVSIIDTPGARSTRLLGISNRGDVVGDADDRSFVLSGEDLKFPEFEGLAEVSIYGINAKGDLVGTYRGGDFALKGFVQTK